MAATTLLCVPFRRSAQVALSGALKKYISAQYGQHPDMFLEDLLVIDRLRQEAVAVQEPHVSCVTKLVTYAAHLKWIGGKFPVDVGANFAWYPALGFSTDQPVVQDNLRFELANVLFNLAVLYSQLAVTLISASATADNIKTGCRYFCNAAGIFAHLRTELVPDMRAAPPDDMDEMTLQSLERLMLAQAQEGVWQRAVLDKMRDASIARLAIQVSDHYAAACDCAVKSNAISTDWIHHMTAKRWHFESAAQLRQSLECLEKRQYGQEIARLREAATCVGEALKETRWVSKLIVSDLHGLKARVSEDLRRAEKDNDVIYLQPVPPKSALAPLERASVVAAKAPPEVTDAVSMIGEDKPFGPPLFSKLVPYAVHIAASIYTDRRDKLVNQTLIGEIESMSSKLREILQALNLPGSLQAIEKPLGLPPTLLTHAEEVRQKDALNRLYSAMQDTSTLKASDKAIFKDGVDLLAGEKAEDEQLRLRFGTDRWTRDTSGIAGKKPYQQMKNIEGYLASAQKSDDLVAAKLREVDPVLRVLQGSMEELENYVPSGRNATMTGAVQREAARLRAALAEVTRIEARRQRRVEALRAKASDDNINPALLDELRRFERDCPMQTVQPDYFEDLFDERLQMYDSDRDLLEEEALSQARIIEQVHDTNRAFVAARAAASDDAASGSVPSERERVLQDLQNGYSKYQEILGNIETGRKFYNDLARLVTKFREECRKFVQARRLEAQHLESDIASAASLATLSISPQQSRSGGQADLQAATEADQAATESAQPAVPAVSQVQQPTSIVNPPAAPLAAAARAAAPAPAPALERPLAAAAQHSQPPPVPATQSSGVVLPPDPTALATPSTRAAAGPGPGPGAATLRGRQSQSQAQPNPLLRSVAAAAPGAGVWSPGMPIRFAAPAPASAAAPASAPAVSADAASAGGSNENAGAAPPLTGQGAGTSSAKRAWSPSKGLRFA